MGGIQQSVDDPRPPRWLAIAVILAAVVMGLPSLGGGFLGGDDVLFVRDHLLVNRPSPAHAAELFTIVHRDLYQPVALLSFSIDFAVLRALGLTGGTADAPTGVWIFHITNLLLHALNAWLVYALGTRLLRRPDVAALAALVFAVHPLNVETVAWINGRMMLLSTAFLLAAVLTLERWRSAGGGWRIALTLLFTALCMMSKVRPALPLLLAVPVLFAGCRPRRGWWLTWTCASLMTIGFVGFNMATSGMLNSTTVASWTGPPLVRVVSALGWYLTHTFVPVGLAPYHPPHASVAWSDPGFWPMAGLLLAVAAAVIISARRTRLGWVALFWFAAAIFATLPWTPSRNVLVAERYTYLPNIGLYWLLAALLVAAGRRWLNPPTRGVIVAALVLALTAVSWHTASYYHSDVARSARMMTLYADRPGIPTKHAWSLYYAKRYAEAIATARRELDQASETGASAVDKAEAWQVIGLAEWQSVQLDAALAALERAVALNPADGAAWARLARVLRAAGRDAEARAALTRGVERAPRYNPGLLELAQAYLRAGQPADARRAFEQALANNRHEVSSILGLAELDIAAGQPAAALARLEALLEWMPENVPARINAGVCLAALGKSHEAAEQYAAALALDPDAPAAVLNLANLRAAAGDVLAATTLLDTYLMRHPLDRTAVLRAVELHVRAGGHREAAILLTKALAADPQNAEWQGWYAWVSWLAQQWAAADNAVQTALTLDADQPQARMVQCGVWLRQRAPQRASTLVEGLLADGTLAESAAFDAFAAVLQTYATAAPDDPWPYYLLALACQGTDRSEAAAFAVEECLRRTQDSTLRARANALLRRPETTRTDVP